MDLTNKGVLNNFKKFPKPTNFQSTNGVVTLFTLNKLIVIVLNVGYKNITTISTTAGNINIIIDLFVCFIKSSL